MNDYPPIEVVPSAKRTESRWAVEFSCHWNRPAMAAMSSAIVALTAALPQAVCGAEPPAARPKVLQATPRPGAQSVDPRLKELRVVFDQPMSHGGMSVVGGGPKFPKFIGQPKWEGDRTFVYAWQLEPGHDYSLSLNSDRFTNFRSATGEPAVPYPISFRTDQTGKTAQPKVVKATPETGAQDVDPQLKELRVVFSQPMSRGGMSVVGGGPTFPEFIGQPKWEDDRTFVYAWQLEPGHDYSLSLNSDRFTNFRSVTGEPAAPHPISFRTRPTRAK